MNGRARKVLAGLGLAAALGALGCGSAQPPLAMSPSMDGFPPPPPPQPSSYAPTKVKVLPGEASQGAPMAPSASAPSTWFEDRPAPRAEVAPPEDRPGLGTQWGETRASHVSMVSFVRADPSSPFASAALYYNDDEGARAMSQVSGYRRTTGGMFTVAGGLVSVGLRGEGGSLYSGFVAGSRSYAVGEAGHRYTIVLRNNTNSRLEVVLSVDGLDVLDGRAASFQKRGYIMDPRAELEVDGFRQTVDAVAAFRFGSVRGSYASLKTGDTQNVGVIGIALFNEEGTNPAPWTPDEVQRRHDANPFPGQFATPP